MAGYVETWGRGIQQMCDDCTSYGCPTPYYREQPGGIMLILKAHPDTIAREAKQNVGANATDDTVNVGINGDDKLNDELNVGINGNDELNDTLNGHDTENDTLNVGVNAREDGNVGVNNTLNVGVNDNKGKSKKLTMRQQSIIEMLLCNPKMTTESLSNALSVTKRTVERNISALQRKGLLLREGSKKTGRWVVRRRQ